MDGLIVEGVGLFAILWDTPEHLQQLAHLLLEDLHSAISAGDLCFEGLILYAEIIVGVGRVGCKSGPGYH